MVPLATHLASEGLAVVLFDYRHWGVSEGLPRQMADPVKELADLHAVLRHIENSGGLEGRVDPRRVGLYGASLGGGLVLAAASELSKRKDPLKKNLKAFVAAVPFVDGEEARAAALKVGVFVCL